MLKLLCVYCVCVCMFLHACSDISVHTECMCVHLCFTEVHEHTSMSTVTKPAKIEFDEDRQKLIR